MTGNDTGGLSRLLVRSTLAGERLDRFLAAETGLSRRGSRALASDGKVWKNGRSTRVLSKPVATGDVIDLLVPASEMPNVLWRPDPINIVHDDRWIMVADKPPGVLSQSASGPAAHETAFDELVALDLAFREGHKPFLRMMHRLDRLTSGLVVFARNPEALAPLDRAWRRAQVARYYLAVVKGRPSWETHLVDAPIARDPAFSWKFQVLESGKPARTKLTTLSCSEQTAVVLCELETGRTHQVRVHLQHLGLPVLGDPLYGTSDGRTQRLMLHAWALDLPHPKTRKRVRLEAPLPDAFERHVGTAGIEAPWSRR